MVCGGTAMLLLAAAGVEVRRSLEMIIGYAAQQGLIPRIFAVEELFDDLTRTFRAMG